MTDNNQKFCSAIEKALKVECKQGLQGLKGEHRKLIQTSTPRNLTGSIDLDDTLKKHPEHKNANRWDYGIGYKKGQTEAGFWVEVHPAQTSEVDLMIKKWDWLNKWVKNYDDVAELTKNAEKIKIKPFVWIASGKINLRPGASKLKQLQARGLQKPIKLLSLS